MRIQAAHLVDHLTPGGSFEVRTADYRGFSAAMPYTEALAMVFRGEVEGVAAPSGKIKYLRILPEGERPRPNDALAHSESMDNGRSTAFANTKMGAYREAVESAQMDPWGIPTRVVIGHIWQLHGVSL